MKRIVLSIVVLLVLLCGIAVAEGTTIVASGKCGASGSNLTWALDSEGTLTISGKGKMKVFYGPDEVPWQSNRASIEAVVVNEGATSIGNYAFKGCSSLSSITIPEGVTSIGEQTFYNCSSLSSITIPDSVTSISIYAFYNCSSLTEIVLPTGVTSIGAGAFEGCSSLRSIAIPDGVTSIGGNAFYGCSSLKSITIPDGVTRIGWNTFNSCSSLSSISLSDSLISIGYYAFYGCSSLSSIAIPDSVTSIDPYAFQDCSSLRSIAIPAGVTVISDYTFYNCSSLSSIAIPEGVTGIGDYTFYNCSSLSSIAIPVGVTGIGEWAFYNCSKLSSITLPEGVTVIGNYAFDCCSSLRSVAIPDSVTSIGACAFRGCSALSSIIIPDGVTRIADYAFNACSSLKSITIPESVTSIGAWSFQDCISLERITIPDSVTSIEDYAFDRCINLREITIPDGVTVISHCIFSGCSSLSSINIPDGVTSIGDYAFSDCGSLKSIAIPEHVTRIGGWAFSSCSNLSSITIPDGVTEIRDYTFCACRNLKSITIPDGVTHIGADAFSSCDSLSGISIPGSVITIGNSAFQYRTSQANILFRGKDMPALGSNVFSGSPTIYCYEYSDVDLWAFEKGYTCVYIDGMDLNRPLSIELPEEIRFEIGTSFTATPETFPENANQGIVWESSDPSIVSVEDGVLTAHAVGEATITASCDSVSDQMNVVVYAPVESFELSETELWVVSKETAQLDIRDMQPANATASFAWESSDASVLTVSGGTITALKPGDATVTVTSDNGVERSCLVHVCYPVSGIELEKSEYLMCLDGNAQITANVTTRDQSYVNKLVTFASSDEAVVSVDASCRMHAFSVGTATICVSATSGVSATCTVEVVNQPHTPVNDAAVPATHVTAGLTEGVHCSRCGEILVAQQVIPVVEVEKLVLPAELETIEAEAFAGGSMVCVVIPEGCRAIGAGAFRNCAQLRFIEIPATVTSIDASAFEGCSDLIIVTTSESEAEDFAQTHNITCVTR